MLAGILPVVESTPMTYGHPLDGAVPDGRTIAEVSFTVTTPFCGLFLVIFTVIV
jgi:hypothetical protein